MVPPLTEKHTLKKGYLSFHATKQEPLIYFTAKAGSRGNIGMGSLNEGEEFIIIPVKYLGTE